MSVSALYPKIYGVLDIGTSAVRAVIATPNDHTWNILGWGAYPSAGLKKGNIMDWERLYRCVQCTWDQTILHAGISQVDCMSMNVGHPGLIFERSRYSCALRKGRVTPQDLQELRNNLKSDLEKDEQKILHTLSQQYVLDDRGAISDPGGLLGKNLQWDALNVLTATHPFRAKAEILEKMGLPLNYPVVDMLAASKAVLTQEEREQGVLMIDLGAGSMKWILYNHGVPQMMNILPIGGDQLTADIALALKTSLATAEVLKVRHGSVSAAALTASALKAQLTSDRKSMILDQQALIDLRHVMTMRLEEMFSFIVSDKNVMGSASLSVKKIVLTGGLAKIEGLTDLAEQVFGVSARTGALIGFSEQSPFFQGPAAATLIGLLAWSREQDLANVISPLTQWKKMFNKLQYWITK